VGWGLLQLLLDLVAVHHSGGAQVFQRLRGHLPQLLSPPAEPQNTEQHKQPEQCKQPAGVVKYVLSYINVTGTHTCGAFMLVPEAAEARLPPLVSLVVVVVLRVVRSSPALVSLLNR
jgi:hypothetical protein